MGVKNLAFCVLDVDGSFHDKGSKGSTTSTVSPLRLVEWERLDLTKQLQAPDGAAQASYTPSVLCKVAYTLASTFLTYQPGIILIERQRFRSGGAAAIQEWTVRVNMLESMLWACLETLKQQGLQATKVSNMTFPTVIEMSPARVGAFWNGRDEAAALEGADVAEVLTSSRPRKEVSEAEARAKRGFEKKEKIALVRRWIASGSVVHDGVLDAMAASFCGLKSAASRQRRVSKKAGTESPEDIGHIAIERAGKLDDLADCVVQAVTFAMWKDNRKKLHDYSTAHAEGL